MKDEMPDSGKSLTSSALSLFDRVGEFDWTLKIASVVLFADSVMMLESQKNIFNLSWAPSEWAPHFGAGIVALLTYSICVAFLFPLLEGVLAYVTRHVWFVWLGMSRDESRYISRLGCVKEGELEQVADEEQSTYLLAKVKNSREKAEERERQNRKFASLSFSTLLFLGANLSFLNADAAPSLTIVFVHQLGATWGPLCLLFAGCFLAGTCTSSWTKDFWRTRWVTYAPLYKKLEKMKEEERGRRFKALLRNDP